MEGYARLSDLPVIAELKEALAAERDRANTAVAAASATRDILAAIQIGQNLKTGNGP